NWTPRPHDDFRESVDRATSEPRWVWATTASCAILYGNAPPPLSGSIIRSFSYFVARSGERYLAAFTEPRSTPATARPFASRFSAAIRSSPGYARRTGETGAASPHDFREPNHAHLNVVQLSSNGATTQFLADVRKMIAENGR